MLGQCQDDHFRDADGLLDAVALDGRLDLPALSGGSILDCCLVNEALAEGGHDGGLGLSLGAHWVIGTVPIWLHGSEELKRRYLPRLCDGSLIAVNGMTEPSNRPATRIVTSPLLAHAITLATRPIAARDACMTVPRR